jgi:cell division protein FtsL
VLNVIRFAGFYGIKEKIKLITIIIITIVVVIIIIKIQVSAYNVINNYHNNKINNIHVLISLKNIIRKSR